MIEECSKVAWVKTTARHTDFTQGQEKRVEVFRGHRKDRKHFFLQITLITEATQFKNLVPVADIILLLLD